ncbi:MAG: Glu/Leu/Phe/Val dehydrogenase dimerization domain-containing protein [Actinomycetota bacterium]
MTDPVLRDWDGESLTVRRVPSTGVWIVVAVHSTALGPGMGGTRMKVYPGGVDEAVGDAVRLSGAMTAKNALAELPFGGGKAVLAVPRIPEGDDRRALLLRYADVLGSLDGSYVTACDMNTTETDMDVIAERTSHVLGRSSGNGGSGTSAPATAMGVFHGIRACLEHAFGSPSPADRTVVVQGAGAVGSGLCELLAEAGAQVFVSDVVADRATALADRIGAKVAAPDDALVTPCDVLSPCATGGMLNEETVPLLRCRVVAGAANNQLATPEDARRLRERHILYAPDAAISAGGVLALAGRETLGWNEPQLTARLERIGSTLRELFALADLQGLTTDEAAAFVVRQRLAQARGDR